MTDEPAIYDDPAAYELAYSFRDFAAECRFLLDTATRYRGQRPASAVELMAGPAVHARHLAAEGLQTYAVDVRPGAAQYLRRVAPEVTAVLADARDFQLPQKVDLAFCPLGGFGYLLSEDDQHRALHRVADALARRGAVVLELVPGDAHRHKLERWRVERPGMSVEVEAGPSRRLSDEVYEWDLRLTWQQGDKVSWQVEAQRQRQVEAGSLERLLRDSGRFAEVQLYADYDVRRRWSGEPTVIATARLRS